MKRLQRFSKGCESETFGMFVIVFFVFLNLSLCLVLGLYSYVFVLMFKFVICSYVFLFKMN